MTQYSCPKFSLWKILLFIFLPTFWSCSFIKTYKQLNAHYSNDAGYLIENIKTELSTYLNKDTIIQTEYQKYANEQGDTYRLVRQNIVYDTSKQFLYTLDLNGKIIMTNSSEVFYGSYPKKGLLNKIEDIKIFTVQDKRITEIQHSVLFDTNYCYPTFTNGTTELLISRDKNDRFYLQNLEIINWLKLWNQIPSENNVWRMGGKYYLWIDKKYSSLIVTSDYLVNELVTRNIENGERNRLVDTIKIK